MKKVFQTKLKNITKVLALVIVASLATFTGCKSYTEDINGLQTQITAVVSDVNTLKTTVAGLQTSVNGMTYIKSITMGTDGKLTITPSTGSAIVYDAKTYVTYDISLTGNNLMVNGVNKGTVAIPALTFGADNKLMSGTTLVADLSGFMRSLTLSSDNYLMINGVKSTILVPPATVASVDVKTITIAGSVLTITKNDGTFTTITLPQTAIVTATGTNGNLTINGVDTGVKVVNTYAVAGGFLTVNGVATTVPVANGTSVILSKDTNGNVISTTITDASGASATIKVNPSQEPLKGLLLVPTINNFGVNAIELGYIMNIQNNYVASPGFASVKSAFTQPAVTYRLNPTNTDISKITAWNIISNSTNVNTTVYSVKGAQKAPGDSYSVFTPTLVPNTRNDGSQDFTLKVGTYVEPATGLTNTFALEATSKDIYSNAVTKVASDWAKVMPVAFSAYVTKFGTSYTHYPTLGYSYSSAAPTGKFIMPSPTPATTVTATTSTYDYALVYNATTKTNVNNLVTATAIKTNMGGLENTFAAYKFGTLGVDYKFVFSVPTTINSTALNTGIDGVTNDNAFITLESNGDITVNQGTASIGRAPIVIVELQSMSGAVLANGYIKFRINQAPIVTPQDYNYSVTAGPFAYASLFKGQATLASNLTPIGVDWTQMNAIYTLMGLSHDQFIAQYGTVTPTLTSGSFKGVALTASDLAAVGTFPNQTLAVSSNQPGVDTYAMTYNVTPAAKFGTYALTYTFAPAGLGKLNVTFNFTVTAPVLDKSILAGYQYTNATTVMTQGMNAGGAYLMQLYLGEAFGYGSTALQNAFAVATAGKIDFATHQFIITDPYTPVPSTVYTPAGTTATTGSGSSAVTKNSSALSTTIAGLLGTGTGTGTLLNLNSAITVDRTYPTNFQTVYPNGEVDNFNYSIIFKNPLTIDLYSSSVAPIFTPSFLLTDKLDGTADTKDISLNYQVKFLGTPIVTQGTTTAYGTGLGYTSAGLGYSVGLPSPVVYQTYSLIAPSTIKWSNAGTKLTNTQVVGNAVVTYTVPSVATVTRTDAVSVQPGN